MSGSVCRRHSCEHRVEQTHRGEWNDDVVAEGPQQVAADGREGQWAEASTSPRLSAPVPVVVPSPAAASAAMSLMAP